MWQNNYYQDDQQDEVPGRDVESDDVLGDEVDVDGDDQHGQRQGEDFRHETYTKFKN